MVFGVMRVIVSCGECLGYGKYRGRSAFTAGPPWLFDWRRSGKREDVLRCWEGLGRNPSRPANDSCLGARNAAFPDGGQCPLPGKLVS